MRHKTISSELLWNQWHFPEKLGPDWRSYYFLSHILTNTWNNLIFSYCIEYFNFCGKKSQFLITVMPKKPIRLHSCTKFDEKMRLISMILCLYYFRTCTVFSYCTLYTINKLPSFTRQTRCIELFYAWLGLVK